MLHPLNHLMVSFPPSVIAGVSVDDVRQGIDRFGNSPTLVFDCVSRGPVGQLARVRMGMLTGRVNLGGVEYIYNAPSDQLIRSDFRLWLIEEREKKTAAHKDLQDGIGRLTCSPFSGTTESK